MAKLVFAGELVDLDEKADVTALNELSERVDALEDSVIGLNGVRKLWAGTAAQFDAIQTPAADTVYLVIG